MSDDIQEQLRALAERVATLEAQVAALKANQEIPEHHLVAIGAAVAAYFGHKAKVRAVRFGKQANWAAATLGRVHNRQVKVNN